MYTRCREWIKLNSPKSSLEIPFGLEADVGDHRRRGGVVLSLCRERRAAGLVVPGSGSVRCAQDYAHGEAPPRDREPLLADLLQGRDDALVYPRSPLGTALLPEDHELLRQGRTAPAVRDIPLEAFRPYGGNHDRAKGPYQITHGDVARAVGYCESIGLYQRPALAQGLRGPGVPLASGHRRHRPGHPGLLPDPPCRQGTVPGRVGGRQAALVHTKEPRSAILTRGAPVCGRIENRSYTPRYRCRTWSAAARAAESPVQVMRPFSMM